MRQRTNCQICNTEFIQKHQTHFNCSSVCRKIDFAKKDRDKSKHLADVTRKLNKGLYLHQFRTFNMSSKSSPENKLKLRKEIEEKTQEFLVKNKITFLPDAPNGKVPEIRIRELGSYTDSSDFYYIEEEDDVNNFNLLEI